MLALLLACDPGGLFPQDIHVVEASCTPDSANAVRARCRVTLSKPGTAQIVVTDGSEAAQFSSEMPMLTHDIPLWGLTAASEWSWMAKAGGALPLVGGTFQTPALPVEFDTEPGLHTTATPSAIRGVLAPLSCYHRGALSVFDAQGRVRWYRNFADLNAPASQRIISFEFTEADTVLALLGSYAIVEVDLTGREVFRRLDFDLPVHHDVARRGDWVYTLQANAHLESNGLTYVQDELVAFDRAGDVVYRWRERDHIDATRSPGTYPGGFWRREFPGAIDAWHTNGFYVDEGGNFLLSSKRANTVVHVADDVIDWVLPGEAATAIEGPVLTLVDAGDGTDATFSEQHNPRLLPGGNLSVFDNGHRKESRGLELALDLTNAQASYVASWPTDLSCPVQSSVLPLDNGHHLVSCASQQVIIEFDALGERIGHFEPTCDTYGLPITVRALPVDVWDAGANGITVERL